MGFTKLFAEILSSSVWSEDDKTRLVWVTLLALKGANNIAPASVSGLAHMARVSIEDCQRAITILADPDPDSRSSDWEGRRIERVEGGFLILNGQRYIHKRDDEDRREYQRIYHQQYRRKQKTSTNVNSVNNSKPASTKSESESESEEEKSSCIVSENDSSRTPISDLPEQEKSGETPHLTPEKKRKGPLMNADAIETLRSNPAYDGVDLDQEAWKFKAWCESNNKLQTVRRFTNWLNRVV